MPLETAADYPEHVHRLSPLHTLQGAVARCDMPVETGPTMYLPHSQKHVPGYLAAGLPEFVEYFARNYVQLPLAKGDAVFFNPALFHGAGTNQTPDVMRMAYLLQVSSAFGRALESVDRRTKAIIALYPTLLARRASGAPKTEIANVIAASAEGYPFPTNLDLDQPIGSLNPETQAELVLRALDSRWEAERFAAEATAARSPPALGLSRPRSRSSPVRAVRTRSGAFRRSPIVRRCSCRRSPRPARQGCAARSGLPCPGSRYRCR
jgi:Phytanoyl-CoA dioxygenase (PhyH)